MKYQTISLFAAKGAIYYVTIVLNGDLFTCEDNVIFHVWRYQVFAGKLTWYFTGVYIIKININLLQTILKLINKL